MTEVDNRRWNLHQTTNHAVEQAGEEA